MGPYLERWNKEIVIFVRKEFVLLNDMAISSFF